MNKPYPAEKIELYPDLCPTWKLHKVTMNAAGFDFGLFQDLTLPSSYMMLRLGDALQNLGVPLGHRLKMIHEFQAYTDQLATSNPALGNQSSQYLEADDRPFVSDMVLASRTPSLKVWSMDHPTG